MAKSNYIGAVILGAAAIVAILRFYDMPKAERDLFFSNLKNKTHDLLDDAEATVEKVEHYVAQLKSKSSDEWVDKAHILRNMFKDLYGRELQLINS
jgi:hypothetical protein